MSCYVSICTDMDALRATGVVDAESPYRGMIDGRSGAYVYYNGNRSMIVLTSIDGLEALATFPFVTVTSFEEICGYKRQVVIDGEPQWTTDVSVTVPLLEDVPAVPEMAALYASIYDRTPVTDEEGHTHTPPKLFAVPGGYDTGHLL